ncbi:hypothetical protein GCM10010329_35960 [Streptomyces spiroverticillatus]|uniref:Uncharacterized protein n=1 Tax=Streptomyces finlayi TaxID=67296 RepID=A0A918WYH4_9ACTN|nr:hypothetical protein [Streptomyces finlayi]GHA10087.1 hypothetical protein GCM10010329_35960 [Streptomyces spiroverticillatus]GHC95827.1 hypothetical protein GCM10010334_35650 [Streptomyces finlayi]
MQLTRQTPNRIQVPAPTVAQCTYGALTTVFSTLAMLLLSQTTSGGWVAVIACAALALGVLVAMTVPMPATRRARNARETARTTVAGPAAVSAPAACETYDEVRVPGPRARTSVGSVGEHSLRG